MDLIYWWLGFAVFWLAILAAVAFVVVVLIAIPWSKLFHWDRFGLWLCGWKISSRKQFNTLKQLWVDHDKSTAWMYRNIFYLPFGFRLYWSHRRDRKSSRISTAVSK